jgi:hypothetical protein
MFVLSSVTNNKKTITMRSNTMKAETMSKPSLRVVKGYFNANAEVQQLVDSAWNFAYNALWGMTIFSTAVCGFCWLSGT